MDQVKNKKGRGGRPKKLDSERRSVRLQSGFTESEITEIEQRAESVGLKPIDYVRAAALAREVKSVPQVNRTAYAELARLAGNLNQLLRVMHAKNDFDSAKLATALVKVHGYVQALRRELLGRAT